MFKTTSSIKLQNFNSPSILRPTALHRHKKAYKNHYQNPAQNEGGYSTVFQERAKTAMSSKNPRDKKTAHHAMKSVYIHEESNTRPMTEQPGQRKTHIRLPKKSSQALGSRPVSQDPTMSKTGTQSTHHNYVAKYRSSLRNLIKAASTRNEF
jgi:hypothetical protein